MKEYNRIKRIWEEPQEKTGSLKKPKLCRGGKPHKFQLIIPTYITGYSQMSQEAIDEYYKSEERIKEFLNNENRERAKYGIPQCFSRAKVAKYYKCEVCGKNDSEY